MDFKKYIREISDWPKPGINFYDITTLLENKEIFKNVIDCLCAPYKNQTMDKVVGIDARGFLLAGAIAYQLGAGISVIRKKGKLPYKTIRQEFITEYSKDAFEVHEDAIEKGNKVLIVDDLLATGGTAKAAVDLVENLVHNSELNGKTKRP